jgi:hypothetical protein
MTRQNPLLGFRMAVAAWAVLIGILALWVMTSELLRPRAIYFPTSRSEAEALSSVRDLATTAAKVGIIRGNLWTTAAVSQAASLLFGATDASPAVSLVAIDDMRSIATRAARLSPYDSRIWLVLAGLDPRLGANNAKIAELLKLSYYTGPNELSLVPLRILLSVQSNAIADDELQSLVQLDIQHAIAQRSDLKPAIALAYRNALPKGREVIEATLKKLDPGFLATIAAPRP